ncbi:hypothetical protein P5V15_004258 [Pogonomyrmex californicus]
MLTPRSETIIQAVTDRNSIGIVNAVETKPGVFIGNCLVIPEENVCPISVINTTGESVEMTTPLVTVDEIKTKDAAHMYTMEVSSNETSDESIQVRKEKLHRQMRTEHLNKEEKKTLHQIFEDFRDIFHLENDRLSYTNAVVHEINTRAGECPTI